MAPTVLAVLAALSAQPQYQFKDTRELVSLVDDAAAVVARQGEAAFPALRAPGSRWRHGETYVFVLDPEGNMRVHPDPALKGKNTLGLTDVNGKPIIRGLIAAATSVPDKPEGWYHYEWPVPGGLLPRWKSTYVRLVSAPDGKRYIVGAGEYNDRMERAFVVDLVEDAVALIEQKGDAAFPVFRDPTNRFIAKDAYIFVFDPNGVDLVHPAFPSLEGKNLLDQKDPQGKPFIRDMLQVARTRGSGWVDYLWPKPGESVSTLKSSYVSKARHGNGWVLVGCGVYLANAPKKTLRAQTITAPELMTLVSQAGDLLEREGAKAYPEFRKKGSKWFRGDTYLFVWKMDGTRVFHAANPEGEGENVSDMRDVRGRPIGKTFLEIASSPSGEGWVHYLWPEPGSVFPIWKSTFVKRVTFPSGEKYIVGSGVYNLQLDKALIKDVVDRASALVQARGPAAFPLLRDKTGPFVFMDTYVFVESPDGTELVNPGQPSLEGKNLMNVRDVKGRYVIRDYLRAADKAGSTWSSYTWYKPGESTPVRKESFIRKVRSGGDTFFVGSGFYPLR